MKKLSLLLVILIFSMTLILAQTIAEYTFSTTTDGTLEDMTGSTALLSAAYHDDDASPVTNIGFTFGFGLGAYTQFSANSNGQMRLGSTVISGGATTPAAGYALLAPLSGDNSIQTTGALHYKVVGSEPNRKLIVEWENMRVNYTNDTTGTYCTMQAWLYEGSNNIKFVYGTMWNMSTSAQARGIYVSTSNVAGSIGQVLTINTTPAWSNTATSLTTTSFPASSAMANLNSTADGERRVFHINYPVYTTPPNPAVLISPANNGWAFTDATLNWAGGGGGATSYDVYFGTSATPPFVVNQGATSYAPALAAGTTYYWNIVARNDHGPAAATDTWSFKTPTATQLAESFEPTAFPPAGWANPGTWSRSTSYFKHGIASAYKYPYDSALYILSTPKVTITATSNLDFWTYCSTTSASATWDVVYSSDRVTWTQVPGSSFTHPTASVWVNRVIDLSTLAGNNYYLGIRAGGYSYASYYVDAVFGPDITPEIPGAPALSVPADLAINVNEYPTFTWTAPITGGVPTGYRLYVGTTNPPTSMVVDQTGLTYTYTTPLAWNTTYYWTVEAYNGAGTSAQAAVRSFTTRDNPIIETFPWNESFDTVTAPALPLNWSATEGTAGATQHWKTATADATHGPAAPNSTPNFAYLYCYLATTTYNPYYMTTPPLSLPAESMRLKYSYWIGTDTVAEPLLVEISTDNQVSWTTLYTHSNAANTLAWYQNTISLAGYESSTVFIRFKGVSNYGNYMTDLGIDDVVVENIPAEPVFSVTPTSWDFLQVDVGVPATQVFTIANTGGGTLDLTSVDITTGNDYFTISVAPTDMSLDAGESTNFTVQYLPTSAVAHEGTVTIVHSLGTTTIDLDGLGYIRPAGSTVENPLPVTLPLVGFTGDTSLYGDDYESTWVTPNSSYIGGDDMVLQFTLAVPSTVSGTLSATAGGTWVGMLIVNTTPNPVTPAPVLGIATSSGSTATMAGTVLQAGTYYLIISTWPTPQSFAFTLDLSAVPLSAPGPVTLTAPVNNATGVALLPTFTWTAPTTGSAPTGYKVYCDTNADPTTLLDTVTGLTYTATTNLLYETVYNWKVVAYNGVGESVGNTIWSFTSMVDPSNPPAAPLLLTPADAAVMPIAGFNFTWGMNGAGGTPSGYTLYVSSTDDATDFWNTEYYYDLSAAVTSYDPTQDVTNPITYAYDNHYFWTVAANNGEHQWPPREFVIESDPTVSIPYTQDFGTDGTWPLNWTQTFSDGVTSNRWTVTNTSNAGGTPYEMTGTWVSGTGISRFICPPINTTGVPMFQVVFNHLYDDYGAGVTAKLQYSHDLTTWFDTSFTITSGGGDVSGLTSALISGISAPVTYVAWVLDGNHYQFDYWYLDNVSLQVPPDHDVRVVTYDTPVQVVPENTIVTPMATVGNNGINTETFTVTCTIGAYTDTQTVTDLLMGATQQVTFATLTPLLNTAFDVVITTNLATDTVAANNTLTDALYCVTLDQPALAMNAQTDQFVQFNLATPGILNPLPTLYTGSYFMSGADWMNGNWMSVEYDNGTLATDNYYEIDPLTGTYLPTLGEPGQALMGIAWDDTHSIMYGATGTTGQLCTLNDATGLATVLGTMWYNLEGTPTNLPDLGGLMIDIAYDNFTNTLYGIDLGNDCLWTINPTTYELTLIGFFGIDINYAQDAAFDQVNGMLFLCGYSTFGGLYLIDTTTGGAYLVGPLGTNAYEVDGFAIPYGTLAAAPVVTIAGSGTLTWAPIDGAMAYKVYSSDDPYGTFTFEATVSGTSYTGPASAKKFYKVTAVGGRTNYNRQPINNNISMRNAPLQKNGKPDQTGPAPIRFK